LDETMRVEKVVQRQVGPVRRWRSSLTAAVAAVAALATAAGAGGDCPADLDGDRVVGGNDLAAMLSSWGPCPKGGACPADLDGDGAVGGNDLAALLSAWSDCPAPPPSIALLTDPPHLRLTDPAARAAWQAELDEEGIETLRMVYANRPKHVARQAGQIVYAYPAVDPALYTPSDRVRVEIVNETDSPVIYNGWVNGNVFQPWSLTVPPRSINIPKLVEWLRDGDAALPEWERASRVMPDFTPFAEAWLMLDIEGTLRVRMTDPDSPERALGIATVQAIQAAYPQLRVAWYAMPAYPDSLLGGPGGPDEEALAAAGIKGPFGTPADRATWHDLELRAEADGEPYFERLCEHYAARAASLVAALDWVSPTVYPRFLPEAYPTAKEFGAYRGSREWLRASMAARARAAARIAAIAAGDRPVLPLVRDQLTGGGGHPSDYHARWRSDELQAFVWAQPTPGGGWLPIDAAEPRIFDGRYAQRIGRRLTGDSILIGGVLRDLVEPVPQAHDGAPIDPAELLETLVGPLAEGGADGLAWWQAYSHILIAELVPIDGSESAAIRASAWSMGGHLLGVDPASHEAATGRRHLDDAEFVSLAASRFGVAVGGWGSASAKQWLYGRAAATLLEAIRGVRW
jgi:hypothetical protein